MCKQRSHLSFLAAACLSVNALAQESVSSCTCSAASTLSVCAVPSEAADLERAPEWIMLHGELEIGTEARPHTSNATIPLVDNVKDEQLMGMGDRGIMLSGGTLNLHGNRTHTWTKLAQTAAAGASV